MIKKSDHNENYKLYAVVAPSISSQFSYAKLGQVITGIQELGFFHVVEAALGADMVSYAEAAELAEKGFLTSSCCPAFVDYIEKQFPQLKEHVSHNLSPAATIAKYIKETTPGAKVVFIGPCAAKKLEAMRKSVRSEVDFVLTFEEMAGIFAAKHVDLTTIEEDPDGVNDASTDGRSFAVGGGVAKAVVNVIQHRYPGREVKVTSSQGLRECRKMLMMAKAGKRDGYLLEGMACPGGCVAGAGTITPVKKSTAAVTKYTKEAPVKSVSESAAVKRLHEVQE